MPEQISMSKIDQKLKTLIEQSLFLLPAEKKELLGKLPGFSSDEKKELLKLLEAKQKQMADFNLGYSKKVKAKYEEWEKLFQKIAKLV